MIRWLNDKEGVYLTSEKTQITSIDYRDKITYYVSLLKEPGLDERNIKLINDTIASLIKMDSNPVWVIKEEM